MIKRNSFTCREIAKDDISAYERFLLTKAREENPNYDDYADERSYKSFFYKASSLTANPAKIVFGLFEGDKIIGHTQINTAQTLFCCPNGDFRRQHTLSSRRRAAWFCCGW